MAWGTGGKPPDELQITAVPEGYFDTKDAKWNAVFKIQFINNERERIGIKPFKPKDIEERTKIPPDEFDRITNDPRYLKFRLSRSAQQVQQTISDVAPTVRYTIIQYMNQIREIRKCGTCGGWAGTDLKKIDEALKFVVFAMDKFGLPKIDTTFADNVEDQDTKELIKRAWEIVEDAKRWPNNAVQRLVARILESPGKDVGTGEDSGTPTDDADDRPDEPVYPVLVPESTVLQQEKNPGDDIVEPHGEIGLVDG